jgi:hypothetical protein
MMAQKCVGCRENRSGCRIRPVQRGVAFAGAQDLLPAMLLARMAPYPPATFRPPARTHAILSKPAARNPMPEAMPAQPPAPPPAPAPAWRRRHGFPRSHGPAEHKVKTQWLTLRCQIDRTEPRCGDRSSAHPAHEVEKPKEPKSRRNPRQTGRWPLPASACFQPASEPPHGPGGLACLLANGASGGHSQTSQKSEGTQEPQESWENPGSS